MLMGGEVVGCPLYRIFEMNLCGSRFEHVLFAALCLMALLLTARADLREGQYRATLDAMEFDVLLHPLSQINSTNASTTSWTRNSIFVQVGYVVRQGEDVKYDVKTKHVTSFLIDWQLNGWSKKIFRVAYGDVSVDLMECPLSTNDEAECKWFKYIDTPKVDHSQRLIIARRQRRFITKLQSLSLLIAGEAHYKNPSIIQLWPVPIGNDVTYHQWLLLHCEPTSAVQREKNEANCFWTILGSTHMNLSVKRPTSPLIILDWRQHSVYLEDARLVQFRDAILAIYWRIHKVGINEIIL